MLCDISNRLQEQLVLDCLATFAPPARPDPDPVTSSNRDLTSVPPRQSSNLLRRLQGVASRDKTPAAPTTSSAGSGGSGRGRGARGGSGREDMKDDSNSEAGPGGAGGAGLLHSSGSVRSRGGSGGQEFKSKVRNIDTSDCCVVSVRYSTLYLYTHVLYSMLVSLPSSVLYTTQQTVHTTVPSVISTSMSISSFF